MSELKLNSRGKMRLNDIFPSAKEPLPLKVEESKVWADADDMVSQGRAMLAHSLFLNSILMETKVLEVPGINKEFILSTMKKITQDTLSMKDSLVTIEERLKGMKWSIEQVEDQIINAINICSDIQDWMDKYQSTIQVAIDDIHEYISNFNQQPETK